MIQKIWNWTRRAIEILIILVLFVCLGWVIRNSAMGVANKVHQPRIQQQESRQMIKEIHEYLLGDNYEQRNNNRTNTD